MGSRTRGKGILRYFSLTIVLAILLAACGCRTAAVTTGNTPAATATAATPAATGSTTPVASNATTSPAGPTPGQSAVVTTVQATTPAATPTATATAAADIVPPAVTGVSPEKGASGVGIDSTISATFSEAMDPGSITTASFKLEGVEAGTVEYSQGRAALKPLVKLEYDRLYTARITGVVKDAAGNALGADYTWSFRTAAAPDSTPPRVVSVSPGNLNSEVALNTKLTAVFSEALDPASVSATTFLLKVGNTPVSGTLSYTGATAPAATSTSTATFTPARDLSYGTTYSARLTTGIKDPAGNGLASSYEWSFTTLAQSSGGGGGGGGGGGSQPTATPQARSVTLTDSDLPPTGMEGVTLGFAAPSTSNTKGTAEISIKYTGRWGIFLGVSNGKLWMDHLPSIPENSPFYSLLTECATKEQDGLWWFFALPSWLDISKIDPEVTDLPVFVSIQSASNRLTIKYRLKK